MNAYDPKTGQYRPELLPPDTDPDSLGRAAQAAGLPRPELYPLPPKTASTERRWYIVFRAGVWKARHPRGMGPYDSREEAEAEAIRLRNPRPRRSSYRIMQR